MKNLLWIGIVLSMQSPLPVTAQNSDPGNARTQAGGELQYQDRSNPVSNSLSLHAGPGYLARRDRVFSRHAHSDLSFLSAGSGFTREGKVYQRIMLEMAMFDPMVTEPYTFYSDGEARTAGPHQFILVDLEYTLGKTLHSGSRWKVTAGGLFSSDVQALNYVYGRAGHFGYYAAMGLGFSVFLEHQTGKIGTWHSSLRVPLVSWLARSPYLVNDDDFIENQSSHSGFRSFFAFMGDGKVALPNELQRMDVEAGYTHQLGERWGTGVRYQFGFIHSSLPRPLISFQHRFEWVVQFNF